MTGSDQIRVTVEDDLQGMVAREIERRLAEALRQNAPPGDAQSLTLVAQDRDGAVVGGLVGSTSYGWLLVKMLWVAQELRGQGIGAHLMAEAEIEAKARGCHGAWLDTSSSRAERFYRRLGYEVFGALANGPGEEPKGHRRALLARRFT